jgi:hypothetical protein
MPVNAVQRTNKYSHVGHKQYNERKEQEVIRPHDGFSDEEAQLTATSNNTHLPQTEKYRKGQSPRICPMTQAFWIITDNRKLFSFLLFPLLSCPFICVSANPDVQDAGSTFKWLLCLDQPALLSRKTRAQVHQAVPADLEVFVGCRTAAVQSPLPCIETPLMLFCMYPSGCGHREQDALNGYILFSCGFPERVLPGYEWVFCGRLLMTVPGHDLPESSKYQHYEYVAFQG